MKRSLALCLSLAMVLQPCLGFAEAAAKGNRTSADTRLYLSDGSVVMGHLVEKADDLFIMKVDDQIFTFDRTEVDKFVTLESLGGTAETIAVTEFPYISFLGGTAAFSVLSLLSFNRASDKEKEADDNETFGLFVKAEELRSDANTARLLGWGSILVAVGTAGLALIPQKSTRRIFPELSYEDGASKINLTYSF